jgi:hypothetical protein
MWRDATISNDSELSLIGKTPNKQCTANRHKLLALGRIPSMHYMSSNSTETAWNRKRDTNVDCLKIVHQFVSEFNLTENFFDFALRSGPELIVGNSGFGTGASESIDGFLACVCGEAW